MFILMLFIAKNILSGYSVVNLFNSYYFAFYITIGFEVLVFVTAVLY